MRTTILLFLTAFFLLSNSYADDSFDLSTMLEQARQGDVEVMLDLGKAYYYGKGTLKDPFKAKCWIKKAYDSGSKKAQKLWEDLELWRYSGKCENSFDDEPVPRYRAGMIYQDPVLGMEFVFIPKSCFIMGCFKGAKKCNKNETPAHKVCLEGFWMGRYEVTQKQWKRIMKNNPSRFNRKGNHPVENVSFDDVQKFVQNLNFKTMDKFSLPTEAQWEYVCRNRGEKKDFPWDSDSRYPDANCGTCNSGDFHGETSPVGSFPPNDLGIYDMAGNVKEWCLDVYNKKAYKKVRKQNPVYDERGSSRVVRGGSFSDNASKLRCLARDKSIPGMRSDNMGFRLVLTRVN